MSRRPGFRHNRGRVPYNSAGGGAAPFDGLFATLFPTAYQILQFEFGLMYSSVPLATAGNTSTTILSLTGTISGVPVPVWAKSTNTLAIGAGATFDIFYDGLGVTPAMTGVTPAVGTPEVLTGAGAGLSITWAAGTSVTNDSWKARCAGITDQSGNGKDSLQADLTKQPIITAGVNGKPGLLFDGVNDTLLASSLVLPTPGTTPWCGGLVVRRPTTAAANARLVASDSDGGITLPAATSMRLYNGGTFGPTGTGLATNTWGAVDWMFSNSASDYIKTGSGALVAGSGAGNVGAINMSIVGPAAPSNIEVLASLYAPASGFTSAAFRAAVTAIYGATVNV